LERVGQIGFSYLKKDETAYEILEEALLLNPEEEEPIRNIMDWIDGQDDNTSDEERLIARIKEIGISDSQKFYIIMENIVKGLSIMEGDERFCYSLPKNKLIGITIGRKYCAIIDRKQRKNNYRYFDTTNNEKNWLKQANSLEEMAKEMNIIIQSANLELSKTVRTGYYSHSSNSLEKSIFDPEYKSFIFKKAFNTEIKPENMNTNLNQILFGPPGTGKTFNTINEALKIVDPLYYAAHQKDRKKLTDRFKELLIKNSDENKGQIAFCTFHQSFSYEDFVEGIKPKTTETKGVYYDTEPGVFKRICQLADSNNSTLKVIKEGKLSWDEDQFKKASFYKLSLGAIYNPEDKPIYEYCRDNGYIAIGFGMENDFTGLSETEIEEKCKDLNLEGTAAQRMNYFIHYLKKGNYVLIGNGNKYVKAMAKVIGDYEYVEDSPIQYNHFRKVEWIFVDENIPIVDIYERGFTQKTMYKIDETALKIDFFTNKGQQQVIEAKEDKKYVLIIDEINRGNVSSIFGELITLIEKDKRAGCDEELEVTLPYSKEPFKVPNNVYLIGTMNTADRSIEALDTALRRRFSFKEFPPKTYLIKKEGASGKVNGIVEGVDLEIVLNTINTRIEKLIDKDHRIGHSYFLKVDNKDKLVHAFKNEIIPLLEEYFFGDYGKIGLVLGSSFVEKVNHEFSFADFKAYDNDIQSDLKEKAVFRIKAEIEWDFSTI
jgi:5-methylcytosine-specific restriction protein B